MRTRMPVVAGQFYPAGREGCLEEIQECLAARPVVEPLPKQIVAGIVPHAGWTFSGELAAMVFAAVRKRQEAVDTFVIFGTAHSYFGPRPAVDDNDSWQTPLGIVAIDDALRSELLARGVVTANGGAHEYEHSIEVQVPFVQHLFPKAKIVPIIVPPADTALALGETAAEVASGSGRTVVHIGSTDLTHYGPRYSFTPMGKGPDGLQWAANVNDRQFIDLATSMQPERLLAGAIEKANACGPGAAVAAIAAARKLGVPAGHLLAYTNSNEVMQKKMSSTSRDSVGYAAVVF
ncbi:MAG: AmmeMemoRadiSam system protein B [Sedimentisphaerales bacterium]|nr:AmmeMemoRadiSam system protein B [Sedimentisphaerales bacterium]